MAKVWNEFNSGDSFMVFVKGAVLEYNFLYNGTDGKSLCRNGSAPPVLMNLQSTNVYTDDKTRLNKAIKTQILGKTYWFKYVTIIHSESATEADKEVTEIFQGSVKYCSINTMYCIMKVGSKYYEIPISYIIKSPKVTLKDCN